eukprot:163901_1
MKRKMESNDEPDAKKQKVDAPNVNNGDCNEENDVQMKNPNAIPLPTQVLKRFDNDKSSIKYAFDTTIHSIIALYLNAVDLMSLYLLGIEINEQTLTRIATERFHLNEEMDISHWDKPRSEIDEIEDDKLQQKARVLSDNPLVIYQLEENMIEYDSKYKKLDKKIPFFNSMPKIWKCNVLHLDNNFKSYNVPLFHDLVLCLKLQRRMQYHLSEWMFGNESSYSLQAGIIEWNDRDINKLLDDNDVKEIAKRFGSYNWKEARIYNDYQDEVRDEVIFCEEKPEFVDDDPEEEATIDDFKNLHKIMNWKNETWKDFMLKDNCESNDGEYEEVDIDDDFGPVLYKGEEIFSLLSDRCVVELGDKSEPAPMLYTGRSPTGNIICLFTATGWSCG